MGARQAVCQLRGFCELTCRIDVGGKLLTNHLKHLISFRQWNVLDQTHVVNDVREACGYVSMDWRGDVEKTK